MPGRPFSVSFRRTDPITELLRSVGPHGLTFVISNGAPKTRKFTWLIVTLGNLKYSAMTSKFLLVGIFYSAYNIHLCAARYFSYPSQIKARVRILERYCFFRLPIKKLFMKTVKANESFK